MVNPQTFSNRKLGMREIFHCLSEEAEFEFDHLSGFWPAYPDDDKTCYQRVWGYGDPKNDETRGLRRSSEYIHDTIEQKGPFTGIIGFSSGAASSAIITSLLEKRQDIHGNLHLLYLV
jgi:hypothetical protein